MEINQILSVAKAMKENELTLVEWTDGAASLRIERGAAAPAATIAEVTVAPPTEPIHDLAVDFNNVIEVKSPMVGVFYGAPSPDSEPFVKIGSKVKKGDVLCIIEAMKLMNEIAAETDGEIVDICAENGQVVEFSQVLFKLF